MGRRIFLEEQVGIAPEPLQGWVIVWVRKHTDYPTMTSNIADREVAEMMAAEMTRQGHAEEIIAVCDANDLRLLNEDRPVADGIHPSHVMSDDILSSCINCDAFPDTPQVRMPCTHSMRGKVEYCCECGEEYPRSDLIAGHVLCPVCRVEEECKVPPPGWRCTRRAGHDGPCAAVPKKGK